MTEQTANQLAEITGCDDALYNVLGLLVRQLHVAGTIEAGQFIHQIRLVADQQDQTEPMAVHCRQAMRRIAASFEAALPDWQEDRATEDLYRSDTD